MAHHKVEVVSEESHSEFWFNKSCDSNRVASVFFNEKKKGKTQQWKIYLGGGSVDAEQTQCLCGAAVLTNKLEVGRPHVSGGLAAYFLLPERTGRMARPRTLLR